MVHKLDVTNPKDAVQAVNAAVARFGRIDMLINNAGYGIIGAVEETPDAEFRAQMDTNFFGAVSVIRAALPHLRRQKCGAIVNVSSFGGQMSFAGAGSYSASKFALEGMSEALAQEVAPFGIKVMIVEPGAFRTNFSAGSLKYMPVMAAYEGSVGVMRDLNRDINGKQGGDPYKGGARDRHRARGRNHAAASPGRAGLFGRSAWPCGTTAQGTRRVGAGRSRHADQCGGAINPISGPRRRGPLLCASTVSAAAAFGSTVSA